MGQRSPVSPPCPVDGRHLALLSCYSRLPRSRSYGPSLMFKCKVAGPRCIPGCRLATTVQNGRIVRTTIYLPQSHHDVFADFQVTDSLPNVTWPLARNWAGNIPVQRAGHPNDTLFFWAFESSNGSFTANSSEPWGIWLNGGCVHQRICGA